MRTTRSWGTSLGCGPGRGIAGLEPVLEYGGAGVENSTIDPQAEIVSTRSTHREGTQGRPPLGPVDESCATTSAPSSPR